MVAPLNPTDINFRLWNKGRSRVYLQVEYGSNAFLLKNIFVASSKFIGYAVLTQPQAAASSSKFIGYAVLTPSPLNPYRYNPLWPNPLTPRRLSVQGDVWPSNPSTIIRIPPKPSIFTDSPPLRVFTRSVLEAPHNLALYSSFQSVSSGFVSILW